MARDRQRAKQRRARRRETVPPAAARQGARPAGERPGAGPLDHGSAGADEAAARLALGADAAARTPDSDEHSGPEHSELEAAADDRALVTPGEEPEAPGAPPGGSGGASASAASPPARRPEASRPAPLRAVGFLRNSWAELQRVQWPDRRQVGQATGVVLLFVIIAGAYLGLADAVAQKIVDAILG